jgi:hypothetical protein
MERLVQTGVNFDFAYEFEEDFDFETDSYVHKGGVNGDAQEALDGQSVVLEFELSFFTM